MNYQMTTKRNTKMALELHHLKLTSTFFFVLLSQEKWQPTLALFSQTTQKKLSIFFSFKALGKPQPLKTTTKAALLPSFTPFCSNQTPILEAQ